MLSETKREAISILCNFSDTVVEAAKTGVIDHATAEKHVTLFLDEAVEILHPIAKSDQDTEVTQPATSEC